MVVLEILAVLVRAELASARAARGCRSPGGGGGGGGGGGLFCTAVRRVQTSRQD